MPQITPLQVRRFKIPNSIQNPKRRSLVYKATDEAILIINISSKSTAISKRCLFKVHKKQSSGGTVKFYIYSDIGFLEKHL